MYFNISTNVRKVTRFSSTLTHSRPERDPYTAIHYNRMNTPKAVIVEIENITCVCRSTNMNTHMICDVAMTSSIFSVTVTDY